MSRRGHTSALERVKSCGRRGLRQGSLGGGSSGCRPESCRLSSGGRIVRQRQDLGPERAPQTHGVEGAEKRGGPQGAPARGAPGGGREGAGTREPPPPG